MITRRINHQLERRNVKVHSTLKHQVQTYLEAQVSGDLPFRYACNIGFKGRSFIKSHLFHRFQ
jgi:hypothetical protein